MLHMKLTELRLPKHRKDFHEPTVKQVMKVLCYGETVSPITVRGTEIVDGIQRFEAYRRLGHDTIPVRHIH